MCEVLDTVAYFEGLLIVDKNDEEGVNDERTEEATASKG